MIYLISPTKKQYKANLHSHSTLSDGHKTPKQLKEMYKSHGYSILAITDHERPAQHQALSDPEFIMLTGYEGYIRTTPDVSYDIYAKEIHMNLFARDPMNVKLICFNPNYSRYIIRDNVLESQERVGSEKPRKYDCEYINEYIRIARDNGYMVAYNHPCWSMEDEADVLSYEGLFSMEICNYGSYLTSGLEYNASLYDKMLRARKRIFCHAADDNHNAKPLEHPHSDSFGAFTMIMPEKFTYAGVIDAMEKGDMYASMGPVFHEISLDGDKLHIECSDVSFIAVYTGSKVPYFLRANEGESLSAADFVIDAQVRYVRVSIQDERGRWADTRGFFHEELGLV